MIRILRRRFIQTAMLSLLVVMLILAAAINIAFFWNNKQTHQHMFEYIKDISNETTDRSFSQNPPHNRDFDPVPFSSRPERELGQNMPAPIGYCIIYLTEDLAIAQIDSDRMPFIDDALAAEYAENIISSGKTEGWQGSCHFRLDTSGTKPMLILLDGAVTKSSTRMVLLISVSVAAISYLLVFILVVLLSKKAIRPLAESYEKQKQFITDAGHELKTPLTVISANTEIARMDLGEQEYFDAIDKQTGKMQYLVKNLISLAKMDEEHTQLLTEAFNLSDAVYDTAMVYKSLSCQQNKHLNLNVEENITYCGEESSIRQVVSILLDNALKYSSPESEITITLTLYKDICLTVTNTCSNAGALPLAKVFDRFYRADTSRSSKDGYGLGLPIAKAIVERHGGIIKASRKGPKDIQFIVLLKH